VTVANVRTGTLAAEASFIVGALGVGTARLLTTSGARLCLATTVTCQSHSVPLSLTTVRITISIIGIMKSHFVDLMASLTFDHFA